MKTIEQLKAAATVIQDLARKVADTVNAGQGKIQAIEKDETRTGKWKAEQIAPIRKAYIEAINVLWVEMKARFGELLVEKDFWLLPMMVLSRYSLPGCTYGTPEDAAVRTQVMTELGHMSHSLLRLEARSAAHERNWARFYLTCLVLEGKGERLPVNIDTLPIGKLAEADEIFFQAELAYRTSELDLFALRGQKNNTLLIELGLMNMRHEALVKERARAKELLWDEARRAAADDDAELEATFILDPKAY